MKGLRGFPVVLCVIALVSSIAVPAMAHDDNTCYAAPLGLPYADEGGIRVHGYGECGPNHAKIYAHAWVQHKNSSGNWVNSNSNGSATSRTSENHVADDHWAGHCGFGSDTITRIYRARVHFWALNSDGVLVHERFASSNGKQISC